MKNAPAGMNSRTTLMAQPGTLARNYVKVVAKQNDSAMMEEEEDGEGGEEDDSRRGDKRGEDKAEKGPTFVISGVNP